MSKDKISAPKSLLKISNYDKGKLHVEDRLIFSEELHNSNIDIIYTEFIKEIKEESDKRLINREICQILNRKFYNQKTDIINSQPKRNSNPFFLNY